MGIPKDRKLFFNIAIGVELTHVSPQVFGLLPVLDAGKDHFGAGNLRLGIFMYSSNVASFQTMPELLLASE